MPSREAKAMKTITLLIAIGFCIARFTEYADSEAYQAFAHLFVGGLFGIWAKSGEQPWYWIGAFASCVEVFAAMDERQGTVPAIGWSATALALFFGITVAVENWRKGKRCEA